MAKLVSNVYSEALFETALEKDQVDSLYEEALSLREIFTENAELLQLLDHPKIVREEKLEILKHIFSGKLSGEWQGLLAVTVEKGRQHEVPKIIDAFIRDVKEYKRIGTAHVESAVELTLQQKTQIQQKLLATTSYVEFEMDYKVNPALIGGLVIRIGDRVVDSSIRTQIYEIKRELLKMQMA